MDSKELPKVIVKVEPDTTALNEVYEKVKEINELFKEMNELFKELNKKGIKIKCSTE